MEEQKKGEGQKEERKGQEEETTQKELHLKVKKMLTKINIKKNWKQKFNNILKVHFSIYSR